MKCNKKEKTRVSMKDMLKFISGISPGFLPLMILEALIATAVVYINIILGAQILDGIADQTEQELIRTALLMVGLNLALGLARWGINKWLIIIRRRIEDSVSKQITDKCLNLDYQILEKTETMDYIQRAESASTANGGIPYYCTQLSQGITQVASIVYAIIILSGFFQKSGNSEQPLLDMMMSPQAGIILLILMGAVISVTFILAKKERRLSYDILEYNIKGNRQFGSYFQFLFNYNYGKQVRIYHMLPMIQAKKKKIQKDFTDFNYKVSNKTIRLQIASDAVSIVLLLLYYGFVGLKAAAGGISLGEMTLYIGALTSFSDNLSGLCISLNYISLQNDYLSNYVNFLRLENEKYDGTLPIEKRLDHDYELEFRNVSFHYPNNDELVLKNITTKIRVGRKLAIVGKNGSGKSTFIKLLCRLYDPTEGEILLNGIDIKKYDYDEYRQIFSVVFQDFQLFSFPVAQNVAAGLEYDEEKVWRALEQAGMAERVKNMEKGLDTVIYKQEDEGVEISGGEAQKLAIARALYKDAPVVILDEPTAALDPVSELEVYERFDEMVEEKTAIYISHRMSSCRFCENIVVFEDGNIAQIGSHDTLVSQNGLYRELWNAQAQYYQK